MESVAKYGVDSCPNCGEPQQGNWRHACGQRNAHERLTLGTFATDPLDHVFNVDSKLLSTLRGMTLRPGRTARAYVDGHRARYVNPLRYCIAFAACCFLVRNFLGLGLFDDLPPGPVAAEGGSTP